MLLSLRNSLQSKSSSLSDMKKIVIGLLVVSAFILLFLSLSPFLLKSNAGTLPSSLNNDQTESSILTTHDDDDMDDDGLSDALEAMLKTNATNKFGDKDNDGLYDFEEYLDTYGTPNDDTDTNKYDYNNSMTHTVDGVAILDIYHYFNLTTNKAGYLRDNVNTTKSAGFTNYLLWNVTFSGDYAGGSDTASVLYKDNLIRDVTFSGDYAGGSYSHRVEYKNNVIKNVKWKNDYAGGNEFGYTIYRDNVLENVQFSGYAAGGNDDSGGTYNGFTVTYLNNSLNNAQFIGSFAGGSSSGDVKYENNTIHNSRFQGFASGGSTSSSIVYKNNRIVGVSFHGNFAGATQTGSSVEEAKYEGNTLENVTFSGDSAGGVKGTTLRAAPVNYLRNNLTNVIFNGTDAGLSKLGTTNYKHNLFTNVSYSGIKVAYERSNFVLLNNSIIDDDYDSDNDGLGDVRELFLLGTNPASTDSDMDSLNDGDEVNNYMTDPALYDTDGDGLNDGYEELTLLTDPTLNDTDGDGLNDGWEDTYKTNTGVDPLIEASPSQLASDSDGDTLTLLEEAKANTDPMSDDTDSDGLGDAWEARYNDAPGVDPNNAVTAPQLSSDSDGDTLTLMQEFQANTNPGDDDTDGDGLNDKWEVTYESSTGVNATDRASDSELAFDMDSDGLNLTAEEQANTDPGDDDTDGDDLNDGWEVTYSHRMGVDPHAVVTAPELMSDEDMDTLTLMQEEQANTDPGEDDTDDDGLTDPDELTLLTDPTSNDTDGDGLNDKWEDTYKDRAGVNATNKALASQLTSDLDDDGLTLMEEEQANTDPGDDDTDDDGLNDGWEVTYSHRMGVDPHAVVTDPELISDLDLDTLTLMQEEEENTDPGEDDTDDDGLNDKWEVTYINSTGVDPTDEASPSQLSSDLDGDGLTLMQEEEENTDPSANDTDGDSLTDGDEVNIHRTDPNLVSTDGDVLNDGWEVKYKNATTGVDPLAPVDFNLLVFDFDKDGLDLRYEERNNTDPGDNDTDDDGLKDGDEVDNYMTDPNLNDTDGDGLSDGAEELTHMTDPNLEDTDNDGLNDGWEVKYTSSPGVNATAPATPDELASDMDDDDLNLTAEFKANTNPSLNDTDGDGLTDGAEVLTHMTDPNLEDTDSDGLPDGWEVTYISSTGVNPLAPASNSDLASDMDKDGLSLTAEFKANTNPSLNDTDGDGLGDGWEVTYSNRTGVDPLVPATADELASDMDKDGLTLLQEFEANTDPGIANDIVTTTNTATNTEEPTDPNGSPSETSDDGLPFIAILLFLIVILVIVPIVIVAVVAYLVRERIMAFVNGLRE